MNVRALLLTLTVLLVAASAGYAEPERFGIYTRPVVRFYAADRDYYGVEQFRDAEVVHIWFDGGCLRKAIRAGMPVVQECCSSYTCNHNCSVVRSFDFVSLLGAPSLTRNLDINGDYYMKDCMTNPSGIAVIERTTVRGRKVYFIGRFGPGIYRATCLEATPYRVAKTFSDLIYR